MRDSSKYVDRYLPRSLIESLRPSICLAAKKRIEPRYTVQHLAGGCVVYRLSNKLSH